MRGDPLGQRRQGFIDRAAEIVYRVCLRLYPAAFRPRFGSRMLHAFRCLGQAEPRRGRRLVIYLRELADMVRASRRYARRHRAVRAGGEIPRVPSGSPGFDGRPGPGTRIREALGDLRGAARALSSRPAYSVVAVVILAVGSGAAAAMFSVLDATLFRPLPYREPHEIVEIMQRSVERPRLDRLPVAPANYLGWKEGATGTFTALEASRWAPAVLEREGPARRVPGVRVTPGLFGLLGVDALEGRVLADPTADDVVVVSHGFWQRSLGGDGSVVGSTLRLDDRPHTVVGVMPEGFRYPIYYDRVDVWRPLRFGPGATTRRNERTLSVIGRLAPGVSLAEARRRMDALTAAVRAERPEADNAGANVLLHSDVLLENLRPVLWLLTGAVGLVLLLACVNVAGLVVGRSVARGRELAVRRALGCGRWRLAWIVTAEALVLAVAGGLAGVLVAGLGLDLIMPLAPDWMPGMRETTLSARAFLVAWGAAMITASSLALAPALRSAGNGLQPLLNAGGRGATGAGPAGERLRGGMVVAQVTLALILAVGAALMLRSVFNLLDRDLGFEPEGVMSARAVDTGETPDAARVDFFHRLRGAGRTLADVESFAVVDTLPSWGSDWVTLEIDGRSAEADEAFGAEYRRVGPDYLETVRIPVLVGRGIEEQDTTSSRRVAVVNRRFVEDFLPELVDASAEDASPAALAGAIGRTVTARLAMGSGDEDLALPREIVGVVGSVREWGYAAPAIPLIYVPYSQDPTATVAVLARGGSSPPPGAALRDLVASVDPRRPVDRIEPLDAMVRGFHRMHDFILILMMAFATVALTLSAAGVYGVMAYQVTHRLREIGVRAALGADGGALLRLVLRRGVALGLLGIGVGLVLALPAARFLSGLYFQRMLIDLPWWDPMSFTLVPALLLATVAAACLGPALRATRVDPVETLRRDG